MALNTFSSYVLKWNILLNGYAVLCCVFDLFVAAVDVHDAQAYSCLLYTSSQYNPSHHSS